MLDTKYNHLEVEKGKYQTWKDKGYLQVVIYPKNHMRL